MYWRYGTYSHDPNTVALTSVLYRPVRSIRGYRFATVARMNLSGEIYADPTLTTAQQRQTDLTTKINALETAYNFDYLDAGFFENDGSPTPHQLINSLSLTGNQIVHFGYRDAPGEYASQRNFQFGIEATFDDGEREIVEYGETIQTIGDGGPSYRWLTLPNGVPVSRLESLYTPQTIIQSGYITGLHGYPSANPPKLAAPFYINERSVITRSAPQKFSGFAKWLKYRVSWRYEFRVPSATLLFPTLR